MTKLNTAASAAEGVRLSVQEIARALGGDIAGSSVRAPGPGHSSSDRSLVVTLSPDAPDGFTVYSFAGEHWQDSKDYVRQKLGLPRFGERKTSHGIEWVYQDEHGHPYIRVNREPPKSFYVSHWSNGTWVTGLGGRPSIPYRLPQILARTAEPVFVVEGEKDADNLAKLGALATTSSGGARKWHAGLNQWFAGRTVFIFPDNDDVGRDHAALVARNLGPIAKEVRIVALPGLPEKGDVSDWLSPENDLQALLVLCKSAPPFPANDNARPERVTGFNAAELQRMDFAPIKYVVPGYLVEGCTLFAGKPKIGKSWLSLDVAIAVASGSACLGGIQCEQGDVLYLALEDNARRLAQRMEKLMPFGFPPPPWPAALRLETVWPRANEGGIKKIEEWIDRHKDARLIIVDVLAMFRPLSNAKDKYEQDYLAIKSLQDIASRRNVAILIVTHQRKAASESGDPFETVSGTLGLSGAADATLILAATGSGKVLYCRGRDIEEIESTVSFDKLTCKWRVVGDATEVRRSDERAAILLILIEANEPLTPDKIAKGLGMARNNVDALLFRMVRDGEVEKAGRGQYIHPDRTDLRVHNPPPDKKDKKVSEGE